MTQSRRVGRQAVADTGPELPLKQMNTVTLLESRALKEEMVTNMKDTWVQTC